MARYIFLHLIRTRSYALGALTRIQRRLGVEKSELAVITRRVQLDQLDTQIKAVAPGIDLLQIRGDFWRAGSRRTWPKGAFNRMLADVFQRNILTGDAISRVATALDVSLEDPEEFRYFPGLMVGRSGTGSRTGSLHGTSCVWTGFGDCCGA